MNISIRNLKLFIIGTIFACSVFYRFNFLGIDILNICFIFSVVLMVITLVQRKVPRFALDKYGKKAFLLLLIYLIYAFISSTWSVSVSIQGYLNTVKVILIVLFMSFDVGRIYNFKLINIGWIISGLLVIYMLYRHGGYYLGGVRYTIIMEDFFVDTNVLFPCFIIPVVLIVVCIMERTDNKKWFILFSLLYIAIMGYYMFLSGSRGAILSVTIAMSVCALLSRKSLKWFVYMLFVCIIALYVIQNFVSSDLLARFTMNNLLESGGSGRIEIWKNALTYFTKETTIFSFLFGSGICSTKFLLGLTTHNMFIECLIEYGVIGLYILITMFINLLLSLLNKRNIIGLSVLSGIIMWGLTVAINNFILYWMLLYYVFAVLMNDFGPKWTKLST